MNVNPTVYPVQQKSQLPYGYSPQSSGPPLHIQPQQSPLHNHFFPGPFSPHNQQPSHQQHQQHQQQQNQHEHQQHQPQQHQHQHEHQQEQQPFPPHQAYQQFPQPSQSFYGTRETAHFSGNGLMPISAPDVPPQAYAPVSNNQVSKNSNASVPPFKASERSPSVTSSQQSQRMAAPAALVASSNPVSQRSSTHNGGIAQQTQLQASSQAQAANQLQSGAQQSQSPPSVVREKARVSVLLEINSHLLQEVVSLQAQGKAGGPPTSIPQQSPTQEAGAASPTSATDPSNPLNNSPIGPTKPAGARIPSQEYIECMRRLQANLAYLAAIADAKKKAAGSVPAAPAIMAPPSHLSDVRELYKKLNALFAGPGLSAAHRSMPMSGALLQNAA